MAAASILAFRSMRCASYNLPMRSSVSRSCSFCRCYSTKESDDSLSKSIRRLMRASAQPVAVITALITNEHDHTAPPSISGSYAHGATLSSFSTVSLDPPLLAFSLRTPSRMADALRAQSSESRPNFVINILSDKQEVEASGFARGVKSFALNHDWDETLERDYIDEQHPLSSAPFHPSRYAKNDSAIAVPVLSESVGALACSIVSIISLRGFKEGKAASQLKTSDRGSELFIAKIHGVEPDLDSSNRSKRLPMVYWDQQYKSVK